MASLSIVIVNWNTGRQVRECLTSIVTAKKRGFVLSRVVVVDNASRDGSADGLGDLALPLNVIRNSENRGFAVACNQGARRSDADYILFLNPDTLLSPNALFVPLSFMEQAGNEHVGVVGIQLVDKSGLVQRTCARFPTPARCLARVMGLDRLSRRIFPSYLMSDWNHGVSRPVDHVTGAFFIVRRAVYETLGGFDERFFVYLEDLDFSYRLMKSGWQSYYLTDAQAFHRGGGASEMDRAARISYSIQSRILYAFKHFNWIAATLITLCSFLLEPLLRAAGAIVGSSLARFQETCKGYAILWRELPALVRKMRYSGRQTRG